MSAPAPSRALWKGSMTFGLVFIPVALHSATVEIRPKMRMLDAETGGPIGYAKVDKFTGEAVAQADVVKGVEVDKGQFVTLTKDEIREALPKTTQTIDIEAFVKLTDVPTVYFNKPYLTTRCCATCCAVPGGSALAGSWYRPNSTWPWWCRMATASSSTCCGGTRKSAIRPACRFLVTQSSRG